MEEKEKEEARMNTRMKITEQAEIVNERGDQSVNSSREEGGWLERERERKRVFEMERNMREPHVVLVNEEQETIIKVESLTYSDCVFAYAVA